ncbi:MAG: DUF4270 family protein [Chitinophagia bacterium]
MAFINIVRRVTYFTILATFLFSCTRISTSELGIDFLSKDAIETKDTILDVETETIVLQDSLRIYPSDQQVIGDITNDPIFGNTSASLFFQLKPSFYPFFIKGTKDSIIVDSAVLVLSYKGFYGDSSKPVKIYVNKIDPTTPLEVGKYYASNYANAYGIRKGVAAGNSKLFNFESAKDSINDRFENASNQIRLRLNQSIGVELLKTYDSNGVYRSDTTFRNTFSGFALTTNAADGHNALIKLSLLDSNTKLALYYSTSATGSVTRDTLVTYLRFSYYTAQNANFIQRNRAASEIASHLNGFAKDSLVYVQTSPGTMVKIKVPGLKTFKNKIIHRAELIAEQVPDAARLMTTDSYMTAPNFLFLGVYDTATKQLRSVPNDYQGVANPQALAQFGGYKVSKSLNGYSNVATYNFNVSRYVQGLISRTDSLFDFRLYAPVNDSIKFVQPYPYNKIQTTDYFSTALGNQPAIGRVRLGGGSHSKFRMRLRIYYTNL